MTSKPGSLTLAAILGIALPILGCKPPDVPQPPAAAKPPAPAPGKGETPTDRDQVDQDGVVRRGNPLSAGEAMTVAAAAGQAKALAGQSVKVTGKVDKVCGAKGCWFELSDGAASMRITSKGYKFFVPKSAPGKTAVIEGELSVGTLDQATAQHYENDKVEGTDQPAKKVEGPVEELAIAAVGLELK